MSVLDWHRHGPSWPNSDASRFVAAGGVRWHVQLLGPEVPDTPVVLLLHGTAASTHSWRDLAPLLAARFRVIALDLPGHGFTSRMARPSPVAVAQAVAALTGTLGLAPTLIIGHSAGAALALTMVQHGLAAPRAVIGLGGALLPFPGMAGKLFPAMARMLFVNPLVPGLFASRARRPGEVARFLAKSTGSRLDPRGIALYETLMHASGHVGGALALMANWNLEPLKAAFPRLDLPVLLAHGAQDRTIPPLVATTVAARLPQGCAQIVPGLGHLAHEEAPDQYARMITDFYESLA
ncbi:alpha/beta fold hydrolase BchO [Polymorphobacter sp.]|uniref:alpha/beta fold hydrolase BchO n=1 Tax=Polymorphobacter sp. TaxID=1909290 RepID=UPI003F6F6434